MLNIYNTHQIYTRWLLFRHKKIIIIYWKIHLATLTAIYNAFNLFFVQVKYKVGFHKNVPTFGTMRNITEKLFFFKFTEIYPFLLVIDSFYILDPVRKSHFSHLKLKKKYDKCKVAKMNILLFMIYTAPLYTYLFISTILFFNVTTPYFAQKW